MPWVICAFALKKRVIRSKQLIFFTMFLTVFHSFFFLCPWANRSSRSLLCHSFLKSNGSNLLSLLFSLQKSNCERNTLVAIYKRVTASDLLFSKRELLIRSLLTKNKWFALCSQKNEWFARKTKKQNLNPANTESCVD